MSDIKGVGLIICILMVLMAYLKQVIPRGKTTYLMKAIISIFILLSFINGVKNFNFQSIQDLMESSYSHNEEVWSKAAELVEKGLVKEFQNFLDGEKLNVEVRAVTVDGNQDSFKVKKVILYGKDAEVARNLLAGRYQIGLAYFEVQNE